MSEEQLGVIITKARKLRELQRARARVRQLERELEGKLSLPQEPPRIPEFLTRPAPR